VEHPEAIADRSSTCLPFRSRMKQQTIETNAPSALGAPPGCRERWSAAALTNHLPLRLEAYFMPNTVTWALPFKNPFVSYQKSILRILRFPAPAKSICRLSPPSGMLFRTSILSGTPFS
jgi:hypothetical protein